MPKRLAVVLIAMVPLVFACSSASEENKYEYKLDDSSLNDICSSDSPFADSEGCNP